MGLSSTTRGWYPSHRRVTRSPLKMVVQGGCRDSVGFSKATAGSRGGAVWKGVKARCPQVCSELGNFRKTAPGPALFPNPASGESRGCKVSIHQSQV